MPGITFQPIGGAKNAGEVRRLRDECLNQGVVPVKARRMCPNRELAQSLQQGAPEFESPVHDALSIPPAASASTNLRATLE